MVGNAIMNFDVGSLTKLSLEFIDGRWGTYSLSLPMVAQFSDYNADARMLFKKKSVLLTPR